MDSSLVTGHSSSLEDTVLHERLDDHATNLGYTRALDRVRPFLCPGMNVVMEGEPGTGKKFHAEVLHAQTGIRDQSEFAEVTSETPEDELRAILFDEERKLLEGKLGKRLPSLRGRATLYLHEIGEFNILHQTMLSRLLIQQQGGQQSPYLQTCVVASTTIPWSGLLERKVLINSLTKSMQGFAVCRIPPLSERLDEIPSLVHSILAGLREREKVDCWRVNEETLGQLMARQWRDNVRELKYVVEDAAINSTDGTLKLPNSLSDEIELVWEMFRTIQSGKRLAIEQSLAALEKSIVQRALVKYNFDQRKTARMLAMTEPNLAYRIKKFNIYIPVPK